MATKKYRGGMPAVNLLIQAAFAALIAVAVLPLAAAGATVRAGRLSVRAATQTSVTCAWMIKASAYVPPPPEVIGGGNPDSEAAYWGTFINLQAGDVYTFQGSFPNARYMSFAVYGYVYGTDLGGRPIGHLYDSELTPSTGVNPFQPNESGTGTYSVNLVAGPAPSNPAPNTIYTGAIAADNATVELTYRIYDSNAPTDTGGVGVPSETVSQNGAVIQTYSGCYDGGDMNTVRGGAIDLPRRTVTWSRRTVARAQQTAARVRRTAALARRAAALARRVGARALAAVVRSDELGSVGGARAGRHANVTPGEPLFPIWVAASNTINFANPDTGYLSANLYPTAGEVAIVRIKVPTFPNTDAGQPVWTSGSQVRYWSMCEYDGVGYLTGCYHDAGSVTAQGDATYIISSTQPGNATQADGVNWLPLGSAGAYDLVYRQSLASPTFKQAIVNVKSPALGVLTMRTYYPASAYCPETVYEQYGVTGCFRAANGAVPPPGIPAITTQPASVTVAAGTAVTFTAAASGTPAPTVKWQVLPVGGSSWKNIPGAMSTSYTTAVPSVGNNGDEYRAVFTNSVGSATSDPATLSVGVPDPASVMNAANGMSLWLDGADSSTAYASSSCSGALAAAGQSVGCWADRSGNGEDFVSPSSSTAPVLGSLNGLGAIDFNATSQTDALTDVNQSGTYQTVCVATSMQSTGNGFDELFGQSGDDFGIRAYIGANSPQGVLVQPTPADWSYGSGSPPADWTDGTQGVEPSLGIGHVICAESATPETISATLGDYDMAQGLVGEIGEVVAFSGVLSSTQLTTVESYLDEKWV